MTDIQSLIDAIAAISESGYERDFLLTWDKSMAQLEKVVLTAQALKAMREANISCRCFDSGLAVSNFRDNSTRTRFSFAMASNLLGLALSDLDEGKSQIAHGETTRETANMISFFTEAVGIRDDIFLGAGHAYMKEVAEALADGHREGVLAQRPAVINLQCDLDHPTQSLADLLHLIHHFKSVKALAGKKIAMSWAYSPSYGKPLSVPQGIIGLMTRFGMSVTLAHPPGYQLVPEIVSMAERGAAESGGNFEVVHDMDAAFAGADVVYPKSWAPYAVMEERTRLLRNDDSAALADLEKRCLEKNAEFRSWECTADRMARTRNGSALYMHCLPADISGVSCQSGEVEASVFERYRIATYRQAGFKPYVIAAMILNARFPDPAATLRKLASRATPRRLS